MKKRVIRMSLAILVVLGILFGLLVALTWDWGPVAPFDFLDGRALTRTEREPVRSVYGPTTVAYSFEGSFAEYAEVCTKADSELSAMGFTLTPPMNDVLHTRIYLWSSTAPDTCVLVGFSFRQKAEAHSTAKSPEHPAVNRHISQDKIGSICVSVIGTPPRSPWPRRLLRRLRAMLRRTTNKLRARK